MQKKSFRYLLLAFAFGPLASHAQKIQRINDVYRDVDSKVTVSTLSPQAENPPVAQRWAILPTDGKLAVTFERWAASAGMKMIWDAKQHVMLSSSDSFAGTIDQALTRVLSSSAIRQSTYPLEACIYPNSPPVLRITRLGDQKDCAQ